MSFATIDYEFLLLQIGALCMNAMEYELKRADLWAAEAQNSDEKTARKCRLAIRKQQALLAGRNILIKCFLHRFLAIVSSVL